MLVLSKKYLWIFVVVILVSFGFNVYTYQLIKSTEEELSNSYLSQYWYVISSDVVETIGEMESYLESEDELLLSSIDTRLNNLNLYTTSITRIDIGASFLNDINTDRPPMTDASYLNTQEGNEDTTEYIQDILSLLNDFWNSREEDRFYDYEDNLRDLVELTLEISHIRNQYLEY